MEEKIKTLQDIAALNYVNPSFSLSFTSPELIHDYYRPYLNLDQVRESLLRVPAYTMKTSGVRRKLKHFNPTFVWEPLIRFQADLIDVSMLSAENRGVKFLLIVLDGFSRYAVVIPLRSKKGEEVAREFETQFVKEYLLPALGLGSSTRSSRSGDGGRANWIKANRGKLERIQLRLDRGSEFISAYFTEMLAKYHLTKTHPPPGKHAFLVERFNQTFKRMLFRFLKSKKDNRYLLELPRLVENYNDKFHRMLGMSPTEAAKPENFRKVIQKRLAYFGDLTMKRNKRDKKGRRRRRPLSVGDLVYLVSDSVESPFRKGYKDSLRSALFVVKSIKSNLIFPMYELEEPDNGDEVRKRSIGFYYRDQLLAVPMPPDGVVVPKHEITKTRKRTVVHRPPLTDPTRESSASWKEVFIKWDGVPDRFNGFMPEALYREMME